MANMAKCMRLTEEDASDLLFWNSDEKISHKKRWNLNLIFWKI